MSNTARLESNIERVKRMIRDIDNRLSTAPDDVSLFMSHESMKNHLNELEQKLIEADAEAQLVPA
jgi:chromosome segregation ATPase